MNILSVISRTMNALPAEVVEAMGTVHIEIAKRPSKFHRSMGVGAAWMGAFVRAEASYGEDDGDSWIFIFTDNINPLTEEAAVLVLLHELGHAVGMDEQEVHAIGLGPEVLRCH